MVDSVTWTVSRSFGCKTSPNHLSSTTMLEIWYEVVWFFTKHCAVHYGQTATLFFVCLNRQCLFRCNFAKLRCAATFFLNNKRLVSGSPFLTSHTFTIILPWTVVLNMLTETYWAWDVVLDVLSFSLSITDVLSHWHFANTPKHCFYGGCTCWWSVNRVHLISCTWLLLILLILFHKAAFSFSHIASVFWLNVCEINYHKVYYVHLRLYLPNFKT